MAIHNQVQLITYPDSLGGNLQTLNHVLDEHFSDIFKGGIHILPPFPPRATGALLRLLILRSSLHLAPGKILR